ncbi:hypothetical protein F8M41_007611 [Gigaspora margarita]|uniref:Uncharacterized protein n=1 Tax=Gigaspora margarita TaxID=4874 RepID=A0A8H4A2Y2_GIGMA|nr:hypothetical protein F8M41_007611 [Gigaspora margarita]
MTRKGMPETMSLNLLNMKALNLKTLNLKTTPPLIIYVLLRGTSASQKTFTSSSKKQTFSFKCNDTLNDINQNIGSRNPGECNNEDFDPTPLNNNIEDSKYSHSRS